MPNFYDQQLAKSEAATKAANERNASKEPSRQHRKAQILRDVRRQVNHSTKSGGSLNSGTLYRGSEPANVEGKFLSYAKDWPRSLRRATARNEASKISRDERRAKVSA